MVNPLLFDIIGKHKWSKVDYTPESAPSGRWGHCVLVKDDVLYLFGGYATNAIVNELWTFDLSTTMNLIYHLLDRLLTYAPL